MSLVDEFVKRSRIVVLLRLCDDMESIHSSEDFHTDDYFRCSLSVPLSEFEFVVTALDDLLQKSPKLFQLSRPIKEMDIIRVENPSNPVMDVTMVVVKTDSPVIKRIKHKNSILIRSEINPEWGVLLVKVNESFRNTSD